MKRLLTAILLFFSFVTGTKAKIHLVFSTEAASRCATDIVVVKENKKMSGHAQILEQWHGRRRFGRSLYFPELARFKSEQSRHIECVDRFGDLGKCPNGTPKAASGSKIILFLKKDNHQSASKKWLVVGYLWIEQGRAYGLYDLTTLADYGSEENIKDAAAKVFREKSELKLEGINHS